MRTWKDCGETVERGPAAAFGVLVKWVFILMAFGALLSVIGYGCGWFKEAAQVAQQEFGPSAILEKYEWLKRAHAALDKKLVDVKMFEARVAAVPATYGSLAQAPRDVREQYAQMLAELVGVASSYNDLASQYNATMAMFNWRFANVGDLPRGADVPLPRGYAPYTIPSFK